MTPPKAIPDRKGNVARPSLDKNIIVFTKVTPEELDRIKSINRLIDESKTQK